MYNMQWKSIFKPNFSREIPLAIINVGFLMKAPRPLCLFSDLLTQIRPIMLPFKVWRYDIIHKTFKLIISFIRELAIKIL